MLERATACLKTGARDSLRCAQKVPRSHRALHSTFWSHGAGDLDLPPWPVPGPGTDVTIDSSRQHDLDAEQSIKSNARSSGIKHAQDGVFLEFLYPAQALAWLGRANAYNWERWERRSVRRSAEGFTKATRGYSSTATAPSAAVVTDDKPSGAPHGVGIHHGFGIHVQEKAKSEVDYTNYMNEVLEFDEEGRIPRNQDSPSQPSVDVTLDDSHHDALDSKSLTLSTNPREKLLRLLSSSVRDKQQGQKAWRLYNELDEKEKADVRLKTELLIWMSKLHSQAADAHCISLYWSIPLEARSLPTYLAVLHAFCRRKDFDFALAVQKEALGNIDNGHQVSNVLFACAFKRELWDLAVDVTDQHTSAFTGSERLRLEAIFWIHASSLPLLVHKTQKLLRLLSRRRRAGADVSKYLQLTIGLAKEGVAQYLQRCYPDLPEQSSAKDVQLLFRHIHASGKETERFFEQALTKMLEHPLTTFGSASVRHIISQNYILYKSMQTVKPSEEVLLRLLDYTATYAATLETVEVSGGFVTPDEVIQDWKLFHGKLGVKATLRILSHFAFLGKSSEVQEYFDYLKTTFPDLDNYNDAVLSTIYVHARRADPIAARKAFDNASHVSKSNGPTSDIRCWNTLIYAHSRVDDLEGALSTFQELLDLETLKPDQASFQPILQMLANRGDLDGINECLELYDQIVQAARPLAFVGSLMNAYVHIGEVEKAKTALEQAAIGVRQGHTRGSLTPLFNILLTAYALRRDYATIMQTYGWMKEAKVQVDSMTYAALLQALVLRRNTGTAQHMLESVMPSNGVRPKAFHYAIVMTGWLRQKDFQRALYIHQHMKKANIKESLISKRAYVMAKLMDGHRKTPVRNAEGKLLPLATIQDALQEAQTDRESAGIAVKEPVYGFASQEIGDLPSLYIASAISMYGRREYYEAIKSLPGCYLDRAQHANDGNTKPPSIAILSALMAVHVRTKEYAAVEACWEAAKVQADAEAVWKPLPDLIPRTSHSGAVAAEESIDANLAEIGFEPKQRMSRTAKDGVPSSRNRVKESKKRLIPTRRHILNSPLRHYLAALHAQSRHLDAINIIAMLLDQGYVLDNNTWNRFIALLCTADPPLALSAFTLTERFLIPHFPGWAKSARQPQKRAYNERLQHIQARHLQRDQLMPRYPTMVRLGAALLQLRRKEAASGRGRSLDIPAELERHVGDVRSIRAHAPKTMFAVQSMPQANDPLQNRYLHSVVS